MLLAGTSPVECRNQAMVFAQTVSLSRNYAAENGFALTLTLSPSRGNSHFPSWKKSLTGERSKALAKFSLPGGEGEHSV